VFAWLGLGQYLVDSRAAHDEPLYTVALDVGSAASNRDKHHHKQEDRYAMASPTPVRTRGRAVTGAWPLGYIQAEAELLFGRGRLTGSLGTDTVGGLAGNSLCVVT
jgi:hypothetical protein